MSLREVAAQDAIRILENTNEFGWPVALTNPDQVSIQLYGSSVDIGQTIDPETGLAVAGRRASVALPIASILAAGLEIPIAISDRTKKPWVVTFNDINGFSHSFKVCESMSDRALGIVTCLLESYKS